MFIEEILKHERIPNKPDWFATTSYKFKTDVWNYFNKEEFTSYIAIELGTSKGYSAKLFSYLFKEVHTINLKQGNDVIKYLYEKSNISAYELDLYSHDSKILFNQLPNAHVYFIDALHTYNAVLSDIQLCMNHGDSVEKYLIFDDYGSYTEVAEAIDSMIFKQKLQVIKYIGESAGWSYGPAVSDTTRTLNNFEGLICKVI